MWIRERKGSGATSLKAAVNRLRSWTADAIASDDAPAPHIAATRAPISGRPSRNGA